jgi:hypothetical protein
MIVRPMDAITCRWLDHDRNMRVDHDKVSDIQ